MALRWHSFGIAILPVLGAVWMGQPQSPIQYKKDVEPIVKAKCLRCHTGPKSQGGLDLSSPEGWKKGGVSGPVLGKYLITRILGSDGKPKMPMGDTLSQKEVKVFTDWVDQGATLPKAAPTYGQVKAILQAHCSGCHGAESPKAGLNLFTESGLKRVLKPGNAKQSVIVRRILGQDGKPQMPMGFAPLSKEKIKTISDWIEAGASFTESSQKLWSFSPIQRPVVPEAGDGWARNGIDRFIAEKHRENGLAPSPNADETTLVRRVYLDVIGLPPTPEELDDYFSKNPATRYENLVDSLLASPHFGERQARFWLDLSRYADTNGFEKDGTRVAWRYRDWLINAFNRNLPFDQFTIQQIAGDMLPNAQRDALIATGFHRNSMHNLEGGVDQDEARHYVIVDRVNTTASVFMGTTLACARCHDHKFDPISQKDYYGLYALMANTEYTPVGDANVSEQKYTEPTLDVIEPDVEARRSALLEQKRQLGDQPDKQEELKKVNQQLDAVQQEIAASRAMIVRERPTPGTLETWLLTRGEFLARKEKVRAKTPDELPKLQTNANRLTFARWLVRKDNPLTARVQVNRIWAQYFGRGIVETLEDFGTQGAKPTHPELLDWLATQFVDSGWNQKALHRKILLSATYRQSSKLEPKRVAVDPKNQWLARMPRQRLEAEIIRDVLLRSSGLLSQKIGGPSVFPAQPAGVWNSPYSGERWTPSKGEDRYRRGIYTFIKRTAPYPNFMAFDATSREECTVQRSQTNTPLQALAMMNDESVIEAAGALAKQMSKVPGDIDQQIRAGFRRCTGRWPSERELEPLRKLARRQPERLPLVAMTLLNLDETITKE